MDAFLQDLKLATRSLRKRPLFAAVAILSIALGVGFNAAIFSGVNALLLRPVPGVTERDAVELGRTTRGGGFDTFTYPDFLDIRESARTLDIVAGWRMEGMVWTSGDGGVRVGGMSVSPGYFEALGAAPARGRIFGPEEDERGADAVAVVSHAFWQDRLGGDPDVVGRTLELNRTPVTVIGVMAEGFSGHIPMLRSDIWIPLIRYDIASPSDAPMFDNRRASWMQVIGRLAPGATVEAADAEVGTIMARLAEAYPESNANRGARVIPLGPVPGGGRGPVTGFLAVLMGLVGIILLIAAANVAGMLLARARSREKEIAIRLALGSGRGRLVRQLLMESLLLFLAGGAAGMALAAWAAGAASGLTLPGPEPVFLDLRPDGSVVLFALGVALATGVLFGLVPALQSSRPDLVPSLKDGARGGTRGSRTRRVFAGAQVAMSLVLLVAAGLFLHSLQRAGEVDAGFDPEGVSTVMLDLALEGYDEEAGRQLHRDLLARLRAMPGVEAAALAHDLPMDLSSSGTPVWPEGWEHPEGRGLSNEFTYVSPGYFETLRIPLLAGRGFTAADRADAPLVVVVNRALAEAAWGDADPIGKRLRYPSSSESYRTVVGVVNDVKNQTLGEVVDPMTYIPYAQTWDNRAWVMVRGRSITATALRREILTVDPRLATGEVQSLAAVSGIGILPQRIAAVLSTVLGGLALFLSALGIYGVIAYSVAQRTREIGVRMAVGASVGQISRWILGQGLRLAGPGLVIGLLAAFGLSRLLASLLFGISPADPLTFVGVPLLLLAAVGVASWVPARRAAAVEPRDALSHDG